MLIRLAVLGDRAVLNGASVFGSSWLWLSLLLLLQLLLLHRTTENWTRQRKQLPLLVKSASIMSVFLCSRLAARPACSARDGSSSGNLVRGSNSVNSLGARASFGTSVRHHDRASVSAERRNIVVHAAKGQKGASSAVIREPDSDTTTGAANWEEFGASVSGEWDGYSAEFNMFGEPLELPSNVVPDAFREWGQEIHDWQTQCPTFAHPERGHLWYKVIRLLPTVGCEADAATIHSVEKCEAQQNASTLAYHKSGSYTAAWRGKRVTNESQGTGPGKEVVREGDEIEVEQCLVHEKTRIRVLQQLGRRRRVLVFREAWEGPFRNGESLGGCAAVTQAFATQKPLLATSLFGKWDSDIYALKDPQPQQGYSSSELVSSGSEVIDRTTSSTFSYLCLPKDTWTLLLKTESEGTTIETGWLVQPDLAIVTTCEIGSSGDLKEVSLRVEKRISSKVAPTEASAEELKDVLTE